MSNNKQDFLYNMLEKILFDENHLMKLKTGIDKVFNGQISSKELRKQIIELRVEIIEKLIEFFPFYLKQITTKNKLNEFIEKKLSPSPLSTELQEKNKLLEEVAIRINTIYEKMRETFIV
ncbi:MAG: hypothetical protein ACFE9M_05220 [Promethearchaeota archaeon]